MIKKITLFLAFIMWTLYAAILASGYVFHELTEEGRDSSPQVIDNNQASKLAGVTLSQQEIAKHNSASDCWIIVDGGVYNISNYFGAHQGGNNTMDLYCGKDATKAFKTKDRAFASDHSSSAYALLKNYYLGRVGETIGTIPKQSAPKPSVALPKPSRTALPNITSSTKLTYAEVAKHNSRSSCWLVIGGNVYNVTNYLGRHPGGVGTILSYCGKKDASGAFAGLPHSTSAASILRAYLIGSVGQTVTKTTPTVNKDVSGGAAPDEKEDAEDDERDEDDD